MIHQECLYKLWSPVLLCEPIISSIVSSCWVCQPSLNLEALPGQFPRSPGNWPSLEVASCWRLSWVTVWTEKHLTFRKCVGSRPFPGQADLVTLLWWHWGLPGLYLPFHTSPRSGVKGTEGAYGTCCIPHPSDAGNQGCIRPSFALPCPSSGSKYNLVLLPSGTIQF